MSELTGNRTQHAPHTDSALVNGAVRVPRHGHTVRCYRQVLAECRHKALNAAGRGKPTMWAYYERVADGLEVWFGDSYNTDGGCAGAALALIQRADSECSRLPRDEAALLWAMSVYAVRILRSWSNAPVKRSLKWLRERAQQQFECYVTAQHQEF